MKFLLDTNVFIEIILNLVSLFPEDMEKVIMVSLLFGIDFDNAYQYAVAEKYGLIIISFDSDFDRTELGRKTPKEVLQG
jgi:predicted nucleic acid-binding protein